MTPTGTPQVAPGWTYDELSELFWHHHRRFFVASGLATIAGLLGVAMLAVGLHEVSILFASQSPLMTAVSVWHRARTSLLTKLRFPGRRVG